MKYDFNKLNPYDFEHLSQSLAKKIFGDGCTSFGEGPDGGREAIFSGTAPFPSVSDNWDGYWVIQAKFKTITHPSQVKDYKWLQNEMENELVKYETREKKVKLPDNLIFFTNIILTAAVGGGQDKIASTSRALELRFGIKHIHVISNHDLQGLLDASRDIATAYLPFILPGDILSQLLKNLNDEPRQAVVYEAICRFLEAEFLEDAQSKLDQAGRLNTEKVNLEKVFIDLDVSFDDSRREKFRFVETVIRNGNLILKWKEGKVDNRYVLKAGPGQGKSTLTQFLAQTYRAYFLNNHDTNASLLPSIEHFIADYKTLIHFEPSWSRIPFKIILKDYAGWLKEVRKENALEPISVQSYLSKLILKKVDILISNEELETIFKTMPLLFIFDGLDEVPVSSNREDVIHQLNNFTDMLMRRLDSDVMIVATTRPQGYSKEFDGNRYQHVDILDLEASNCRIYLKKLLENIIDNVLERENKLRILDRALADSQVSRIMKSPLQASIMTILVKIGGEPPTNKFDLFKQYFDTIFNREKQREISPILTNDKRWIVDIHHKLGLYLQAISEKNTNPSATIALSDFEKLVLSYLIEKGVEEVERDNINQEIQNAAIDRLVFISHLEEGKIGFAIRSLQEYFAANGYIHNTSDPIVRERIRNIAGNAYWSNTLLFVIGYLADSKAYLIDFILSICSELNGESNDPTEITPDSIIKSGSWLALDILNEGIFKQDPKLENRFCTYLETLLDLPFVSKHREMANLSSKIVDKWLKVFLKAKLEENISNDTCWKILCRLPRLDTTFIDEMVEMVPNTPEIELKIVNIIFQSGYVLEQTLDRFNCNFPNYFLSSLIEMFDSIDDDVLLLIFKGLSDDNLSRAWEILFWLSSQVYEGRKTYVEIFKHYSIDSQIILDVDSSGFWGNEIKRAEVMIVEGYEYAIEMLVPNPSGFFNEFKRVSGRLGNQFCIAICKYLENQTFVDYHELHSIIDNYPDIDKSYILANIIYFDSLLYFFEGLHIDNESIFVKAKNDVLNVLNGKHIIEPSDILYYKAYAKYKALNHGGEIQRIKLFIEKFSDFSSLSSKELFFVLINWSSFRITREFCEALADDKIFMQYYRKNLIHLSDKVFRYGRYRVPELFYLLDVEEIAEYISIQYQNETSYLEFYSSGYSNNVEKDFFIEVFKKCCRAIQLQIFKNQHVSYKYLIQLTHVLTTGFQENDLNFIPYSDILDDKFLDIWGAIILLMDPNFGSRHSQIVEQTFSQNLHFVNNVNFSESFELALDLMGGSIEIQNTLIVLYAYLKGKSPMDADILEHIKQIAQNKVSSVAIMDNYIVN